MGFCNVKGKTMYTCCDCGKEFEVPSIETVQRAGEPSFDMESCPDCGSEFIFLDHDSMDEGDCGPLNVLI